LKLPVDVGLFFFAFANAGVAFSSINAVTWMILLALIVGKVIGITALSAIGAKIGFPLPEGMTIKHLFVASIIAGLGLTVALFVAGEAFPDGSPFQGPAKMGAVFSAGAAALAFVAARFLGIKPQKEAA
jgi:NhaA family Na+:H+ antiporter